MTSAQHLKNTLVELFPGCNILTNVKKGSKIQSPKPGIFLELDFIIDECNLAFEFQDPSHYVSSHAHRSLTTIQELDQLKQSTIDNRGDTLITIPFWWDGHADSLVATIRSIRPDLLKSYIPSSPRASVPIPLVPPNSIQNESPQPLPTIGELTLPSFAASTNLSFKNWWISEKYDGVRVCWNPDQKILYTRHVKEVVLPKSFISKFPPFFLDGEIWYGRGGYEEIHETFVNQARDYFRILVFDCPSLELQEFTFEIRVSTTVLKIAADHEFLIHTPQMSSTGRHHVRLCMKWITEGEGGGGEGIVVREPKMSYIHGRTNSVIKLKMHHDDEAIVVSADPSGYVLLLPNGVTFNAKVANEEIEIKIGDVVSFIDDGVSVVPANSKILRVRREFSWEEFMLSHNHENRIGDTTPENAAHWMSSDSRTKREMGYWTREEGKELKAFLDDFAKKKNFDPLVADNWYNVTSTDIRQEGGGGILNHFQGSIIAVLMNTYPFIGLSKSKFKLHPKFHWEVYENRKQFFEELAIENGLDSTKASDWYKLNYHMLANKKGGLTLVQRFGSIERLIKDVYPYLNLEASKFVSTPFNFWKDEANCKAFFEGFAKKFNFDSLVPQNWYKIRLRAILEEKGATGLLRIFRGSFSKALLQTYPDIGIDLSAFQKRPHSFWKDIAHRKNFFEKVAVRNKFNPTSKEHWYSITKLDILMEKGGIAILRYYNSSIRSALMDVFPDIDFDANKFIFVK